ncbi:MAG: hypothetical protein ACRD5H_14265 [Nitrososphaerales archaeon]
MEIDQNDRLKKPKYGAIGAATVLVMAFVFIQPAMQTASAVETAAGLPAYDDCRVRWDNSHTLTANRIGTADLAFPWDPVSMASVKRGEIVKTVHIEKEIFDCFLTQGNLPVITDVTTYIEIFENITDRKIISTSALVTTCLKDEGTAVTIDCESYTPSSSPVPVGIACNENGGLIAMPQELNLVRHGKIAKTIESQKEQFFCSLSGDTVFKKVDIILFTEVYEDMDTQTILETQFHEMRCVVLEFDSTAVADGGRRDATVESCKFRTLIN